jgi:hypothetical protein
MAINMRVNYGNRHGVVIGYTDNYPTRGGGVRVFVRWGEKLKHTGEPIETAIEPDKLKEVK